jgi:hypothetical protein
MPRTCIDGKIYEIVFKMYKSTSRVFRIIFVLQIILPVKIAYDKEKNYPFSILFVVK